MQALLGHELVHGQVGLLYGHNGQHLILGRVVRRRLSGGWMAVENGLGTVQGQLGVA